MHVLPLLGMVEISRLSFMKLDSKERWYALSHRPDETEKQKKEEIKGRVLIRVGMLWKFAWPWPKKLVSDTS